ncbi:MAG: hypothetical protein N2Z74_00575 [Syntrophales bacterium]|nr:hypothetical protein [Syntrophales bacterium]
MDKVLEGKRLAIQERSSLAPLYNTLKQEVERKISNALPTPPREKLAQNQIGTIPIAFRTAAQTSGMTMITATPQLSAMSGDAPFIAIDVVVQGKFLDFRKFLINIAALPYIEHIEEIAIQEGTTDRTFKLKVWAAVG